MHSCALVSVPGQLPDTLKFCGDAFALLNGEDAIYGGQRDVFYRSAGPVYFQLIDSYCVAQPEMDPLVV